MKNIDEIPDDASMTAQFRATLVIDSLPVPPSAWHQGWKRVCGVFTSVWTTTGFDDSEVTDYAQRMMLEETRKGIAIMATLSLLTQVSAVLLYHRLGLDGSFLYTYGLLALLSAHIVIASSTPMASWRCCRRTSSCHRDG